MAKAKQQSSPQESAIDRSKLKSENFVRLARLRMTTALEKLDGIKKLSNRGSYTYDTVQVQKILHALKSKVNEIEAAYTASTAAPQSTFDL
jgi:hypothetical protein